jgi:LPS-assembly lipoprotein
MSAGTIRLGVVAAASLLVAACGFHPLYGHSAGSGGTSAIFASIYVDPIPERTGYELRNSLIDQFDAGRNTHKTYRLKITLDEQRKGIALQTDATITRYNYVVAADYVLSDSNGHVVTTGHESTLSSYNVVASPYATLTARQDAQKRAAEDLAQRIRLDLGVFLARRHIQ